MPVTPNVLLQASRQAKTQAACANPPALTAEPGDKAASFAHVYANQAQSKPNASGFARYYQERNARLGELQEGYVRVHLQVAPTDNGGCLTIQVEDSGEGFDVERVMERPLDAIRLSGRGISLIRQLGRNARWTDNGRSARVEFIWEALA